MEYEIPTKIASTERTIQLDQAREKNLKKNICSNELIFELMGCQSAGIWFHSTNEFGCKTQARQDTYTFGVFICSQSN